MGKNPADCGYALPSTHYDRQNSGGIAMNVWKRLGLFKFIKVQGLQSINMG